MTNLEQEHRLVVAFELKNGMEELEIWAQSWASSNFKGLFMSFEQVNIFLVYRSL